MGGCLRDESRKTGSIGHRALTGFCLRREEGDLHMHAGFFFLGGYVYGYDYLGHFYLTSDGVPGRSVGSGEEGKGIEDTLPYLGTYLGLGILGALRCVFNSSPFGLF